MTDTPKPSEGRGLLLWLVRHAKSVGDIDGNLAEQIEAELAALRKKTANYDKLVASMRKAKEDALALSEKLEGQRREELDAYWSRFDECEGETR